MDALAYDVLVDHGVFPEVEPRPLRGCVWLLGEQYHLPQDKAALGEDVRSKIWCTYRKNFRAISNTSVTCDTGWGCTLRCGQMLLAQTLISHHLGREWRWSPKTDNPMYMSILRKFLETRDSEYSLHMIALQGADFGRQVGQWFGPNNVAQAIKKLSIHDGWSQLAVHVAMDMVVVIDDMKCLCRQPHEIPGMINITTEAGEDISFETKVNPMSRERLRSYSQPETSHTPPSVSRGNVPRQHSASFMVKADPSPVSHGNVTRQQSTGFISKAGPSTAVSNHQGRGVALGGVSGVVRQRSIKDTLTKALEEEQTAPGLSLEFMKVDATDFEDTLEAVPVNKTPRGTQVKEKEEPAFRPLLLFIPLRLGQDNFNQEYAGALKACLTVPQSVGFIGGKPRHALYFIGYHEDHLLYLDPHTTQPTVQVSDSAHITDHTYHCSQPDRMNIKELDPSLALGFYCRDEADIDDLCARLKSDVLKKMGCMFELTEKRPNYWGPLEPNSYPSLREPFQLVGDADIEGMDSDDGFELLEWPSEWPQLAHDQ